MLYVNRLVWDAWNVAHIAQHQVTPQEVEEACQSDPFVRQTYNQRLLVTARIGNGRMLSVVLAVEQPGIYYPVSARDASRKERQAYREQKGGGAA